jgi:hypothetical protein
MSTDDDHDDRKGLLTQIAHQLLLLRDARQCGITTLVARRQATLRALRLRLRNLDKENKP